MKYKVKDRWLWVSVLMFINVIIGGFIVASENNSDRIGLLMVLHGIDFVFLMILFDRAESGKLFHPHTFLDFEREAINQKAQQLLDEAKELGRK